jgi:uncharacterized protein YwqG
VPLFRRRSGRAEPEPEPARRATREEIAQRLLAASPSGGAYLAENLLPAVRFATRRVPEAAIDLGGSKFGCSPDLPSGTAWPCWTTPEGERLPLQFFAQVDLAAAAAAAPAPLGLPTQGQLSFFADFDMNGNGVAGSQPDGSVVLYSPSDVPYARCSPRIPPLPSGELRPIGVWTWPSSVPGQSELQPSEQAALDQLARELELEVRREVPELWHGTARHQLGGHVPRTIPALAGPSGNGADGGWRVLLHLDSDPSLDITWGDGGSVAWAAREKDVAGAVWDAGTFTFQPSRR